MEKSKKIKNDRHDEAELMVGTYGIIPANQLRYEAFIGYGRANFRDRIYPNLIIPPARYSGQYNKYFIQLNLGSEKNINSERILEVVPILRATMLRYSVSKDDLNTIPTRDLVILCEPSFMVRKGNEMLKFEFRVGMCCEVSKHAGQFFNSWYTPFFVTAGINFNVGTWIQKNR